MPMVQSRRRFMTNARVATPAGLSGMRAAGLGGNHKSPAAEPPPEMITIRLEKDPVTCIAPQAGVSFATAIQATADAAGENRRRRQGCSEAGSSLPFAA
jgi:hypothetical protein